MKSNEELYAFIDELIGKLENRGDFEWAERLRRAMLISSVVTEVFMALRKELTALLQSEIDLDGGTRAKLREAIGDIGHAL